MKAKMTELELEFVMDESTAKALHGVVAMLYDRDDGQIFLEFIEQICGKYVPNYIPGNETSILVAEGRSEILRTIRNLRRLTPDQIVNYYTGE